MAKKKHTPRGKAQPKYKVKENSPQAAASSAPAPPQQQPPPTPPAHKVSVPDPGQSSSEVLPSFIQPLNPLNPIPPPNSPPKPTHSASLRPPWSTTERTAWSS